MFSSDSEILLVLAKRKMEGKNRAFQGKRFESGAGRLACQLEILGGRPFPARLEKLFSFFFSFSAPSPPREVKVEKKETYFHQPMNAKLFFLLSKESAVHPTLARQPMKKENNF